MRRFEITDETKNEQFLDTKSAARIISSCSVDSGIQLSPHVESFLDDLDERENLVLESCQWPTESADLILKVDESLFPVHRMVLWESSKLLRCILETITITSSEDFDMITLNGVNAHDVEDILPYFYDQYHPIDELQVSDLLRIAEFFEATKVTQQCELFLMFLESVHPIDLLKIAKKFELNELAKNAIERASKIPKIAQYSDFDGLDMTIQNEILIRVLRRKEKRHKKCKDSCCKNI